MQFTKNNPQLTPNQRPIEWVLCKAPLAIDLYCGLGGWAEGFLSEGYHVIGFDIERHDYGTGGYPGQLVIQDVRTLHGSQFKDAAVIVASPPCQAYSYRAMPWKRAKALPPPDNTLFNECFRIQREASEAAARYIPLIVENVRGAQKWVGNAKWHFGSYYLWGDVPALMPITFGQPLMKPQEYQRRHGTGSWFAIDVCSARRGVTKPEELKTAGLINIRDGHSHTRHLTNQAEHLKVPGINLTDTGFNVGAAQRYREEFKQKGSGAEWFDKNLDERRKQATAIKNRKDRPDYPYSPGDSRKAASAQIAKIPLPLAQHIARVFKPVVASLLFLLAFSSPRKVAFMADDACTRQLSLNFNITEEHVPTADLYNFSTPVRDLPAQPNSEVTSQPVLTLEPGALPPALDELAKKYRPFIDRVLARLSEAERKEVNTHLQQDIRQAWITVSYAQRMSDAFVQASYVIYGKHPDQVWPAIVADRKARLGAEYYDWYSSDDLLRPDVPRIPPVSDTSSAAIQGGKAAAGAGTPSTLAPPAPDSDKEAV